MSDTPIAIAATPKQRTPLSYLLLFVFALFIGILIAVYVIAKRSNPILLDEHGKQIGSHLFVPKESAEIAVKV